MGTQRRMDSDEGPETPESCRSCAIADITREFISTTRAINPPARGLQVVAPVITDEPRPLRRL